MPDNRNQIKTMAQILASSSYQEGCKLLFEIFSRSREFKNDPRIIWDTQKSLIEFFLYLKEEKNRIKQAESQFGLGIIKRLTSVLMQIADSIAWRSLKYDRVPIQLMAEHSKTGEPDETIIRDFSTAEQILEHEEQPTILINDLTTILRHGDLTIIDKDKIRLLETKHGKASRKNRRAKRQRRTLDQLIEFMNVGYRFREDRREFLYKTDTSLATYHSNVKEAINAAKQIGYCQMVLSDCLRIEVTYPNAVKGNLPTEHLFEDEDKILPFTNLFLFENTAPGIAPYGIFPFDNETCFDIMAGNIFITGYLNLESLRKLYEKFGLYLELPDFLKWETLSSVPEKKSFLESTRFVVGDGDKFIGLTLFNIARICAEFITEDSVIKTNVQILNLIKGLRIPPDRVSSFYIGHKNETSLWT